MTLLLQQATTWLAWIGLGLAIITIFTYLINWGIKFRLTGVTIFTLLLSASCWAFTESYTPPLTIEGYKYAPVVYDNGYDLVIAQATDNFPIEAVEPTLEQIAGNLKGGGRNGAIVNVRLRKIVSSSNGVSEPIILGEVIRDIANKITTKKTSEKQDIYDTNSQEISLTPIEQEEISLTPIEQEEISLTPIEQEITNENK